MKNYRHIIFDFDGVLAETNKIRFEGFRLLFNDYPESQVSELITYAERNSGMSRYEKIQYFFKVIRHETVSSENIQILAKQYSELVKQKVVDAVPVKGSLEFLESYANNYNFAIISGSEQEELRQVCNKRGIDNFFVEILGSPMNKQDNLAGLLLRTGWKKQDCVFIGDSINDLDAAMANGIDFIGMDSGITDWDSVKTVCIIRDFTELPLCL